MITDESEIEFGLPVLFPSVLIETIGAGGGSIPACRSSGFGARAADVRIRYGCVWWGGGLCGAVDGPAAASGCPLISAADVRTQQPNCSLSGGGGARSSRMIPRTANFALRHNCYCVTFPALGQRPI